MTESALPACPRDVGDKRSGEEVSALALSSSPATLSFCGSPHGQMCLDSSDSESCPSPRRSDTASSSTGSSSSLSASPVYPRFSSSASGGCGVRLLLLACGAVFGLVCGLVVDGGPLSSPDVSGSFCPPFHTSSKHLSASPLLESAVLPRSGPPSWGEGRLTAALQLIYLPSLSLTWYPVVHRQQEKHTDCHAAEQRDKEGEDRGRDCRTDVTSYDQGGTPGDHWRDPFNRRLGRDQESHLERAAAEARKREAVPEDKCAQGTEGRRTARKDDEEARNEKTDRLAVSPGHRSPSFGRRVVGDGSSAETSSLSPSSPSRPSSSSSSLVPGFSSFPELLANLSWLFMVVAALLPKQSVQEAYTPPPALSRSDSPAVLSRISSLRAPPHPGSPSRREGKESEEEGVVGGRGYGEGRKKRPAEREAQKTQARRLGSKKVPSSPLENCGGKKHEGTARSVSRSSVERGLVPPGPTESIALLFLSFSCSFFMTQSLFGCGPLMLQLEGVYLLLVTAHHLSEYLFVFCFHPDQLSTDSFLLNNTPVYACAILLSVCELRAKPRLFPAFFHVGPGRSTQKGPPFLQEYRATPQHIVPWKNLLFALLDSGCVNLVGGGMYAVLSLIVPGGFLGPDKGREAFVVDGRKAAGSVSDRAVRDFREQDRHGTRELPFDATSKRNYGGPLYGSSPHIPSPSSLSPSRGLVDSQLTSRPTSSTPLACARSRSCCPSPALSFLALGEGTGADAGVCLRDEHAAVGAAGEEAVLSWLLPFLLLFSFLFGLLLAVAGLCLRLLAFVTARKNFTHKIAKKKLPSHRLVRHGVYGVFRHPAYTGWFYWAVGSQFLLANVICVLLFACLSFRFFLERIVYEERLLEQMFPREYASYRRATPRLGIPFLQRAVTRWQLAERKAARVM